MDIYSLLKIDKGTITSLPVLASRVADHQIEKMINEQVRKLKEIENRMPEDQGLQVSKQSIDEVIWKVIRCCHQRKEEEWSMRELRIVSYYLMKLRGYDEAYTYAVELLDKHWRNLYINGLVFFLLNSWNTLEANYKSQASQLLVKRLMLYTDNNKRYLCLKSHCNLLEPTGPIRLAALLQQKGIDLKDAPTLLGYKSSTLSQSYYSDVIIRYIKANDIHDLDTIDEIFELHDMDRTRKLVLAHLVERENNYPDGLKRVQLCKYVNRQLGDISMASTWAPFLGATQEEAQLLKRSMELVNNWFKQQIIETFFDICVQDEKRRIFWLQYINIISAFKIVGSGSVKSRLRQDNRIGTLFSKHFIETNSYNSQTSALILFIKDKMIVEFSDTGALYVYKHNHSQVKMVLQCRGNIGSINDLKIPSMGPIIEPDYWGDYDFYEEGKMTHQGHWVNRLHQWMNKILLPKEIFASPFVFDKKEEELFQANPAPIESIKEPEPRPNEEVETTKDDPSKGPDSTSTYIKDKADRINKADKVDIASKSTHSDNSSATPKENFQEEKVFENITISVVSNTIYEHIRVISNNNGFYLYNEQSQQFILLRHFTSPKEKEGNLWMLKAPMKDWYEIVHSKDNVKTTIGFVKEAKHNKGMLFKERMDIAAKRRLKF